MKIALVIQNPDPRRGGAELYTLNLARALAGRGHDVTLAAETGSAETRQNALAHGYRCEYLGSSGRTRWGRMRDFLQRAARFYDRGQHEIVHAMLPLWKCDVYHPQSGLATQLLAQGHLKHPGALVQPFSWIGNHCNAKRTGQARVERALMVNRPCLLSLSFSMQNFARVHFSVPEERLVMLRYGIDLARFNPAAEQQGAGLRQAMREQWKLRDGQRVALCVGHDWIRKGVRDAIAALGILHARKVGREVVLVLVGRDDPEPYSRQAERLGVADRVVFAGSTRDPRPFYGAADFFLLPTLQDNCSIALLEALVMGVPVITTVQNGAGELIEPGKQGFVIQRGDVRALAEGMKSMLDDTKRSAMARAALAMRDDLSFEAHLDAIERVYRMTLDTRRSGGGGREG